MVWGPDRIQRYNLGSTCDRDDFGLEQCVGYLRTEQYWTTDSLRRWNTEFASDRSPHYRAGIRSGKSEEGTRDIGQTWGGKVRVWVWKRERAGLECTEAWKTTQYRRWELYWPDRWEGWCVGRSGAKFESLDLEDCRLMRLVLAPIHNNSPVYHNISIARRKLVKAEPHDVHVRTSRPRKHGNFLLAHHVPRRTISCPDYLLHIDNLAKRPKKFCSQQ